MTGPPLRHLLISREFPPASYPAGGIGTYAQSMAQLLAQAGDTVHVIAERWSGAPNAIETRDEGRLVIHRINCDAPIDAPTRAAMFPGPTTCISQRFAWHAALLAESLIDAHDIDVVEGQDFEAPLYFLLGRRALARRTTRRPVMLVHLHTPTTFVFAANQWTPYRPDTLTTIAMESYCLHAADAFVAPSTFMVREVNARLAPHPRPTVVVPYPLGASAAHTLTDEQPARASAEATRVLYVGRLEPRKGATELLDAAVRIASTRAAVTFEFIGASVPYRIGVDMRAHLQQRIPSSLRERITLRDAMSHDALRQRVAAADLVVIPSRFENFPFTCMEAMQASRPVLVTAHGGMTEMVTDGETGWVAPAASVDALTQTLARALDTPPERRRSMGHNARQQIAALCDNARVVQAHREWRRSLLADLQPNDAAAASSPSEPFVPVRCERRPTFRALARLSWREMLALLGARLNGSP